MSVLPYDPMIYGAPCPKCGLLHGHLLEYVWRAPTWDENMAVRLEWLTAYAKRHGRSAPDTALNEWLLVSCGTCGYVREMEVENPD